MKKKVGIVTIYDLTNYGNRLQNYALTKVIQRLGFDVFTVTLHHLNCSISKEKIFRMMFHELTNYKFKRNSQHWKLIEGREYSFKKFTLDYIPTVRCTDTNEINDLADYFVVGSDQVWNPIFWTADDEVRLFLLDYVDSSKKKSYAPSFGVETLPEEWINKYGYLLSDFNNISVREKSAVEIIKKVTGKNAVQMIDPTMLLTRQQWASIQRRPRNISFKKPYIMQYFIGEIPNQAKQDESIIKDKYNFESYSFLDKSQPDVYACGPREFLYMISHASVVLTDSFHACVFSFIFDVPFVVYDRRDNDAPDMTTRIYDLLNQFHLDDRSVYSIDKEDFLTHDYSEGKKILEKSRKTACEYLKNELNP